MRLDQSSIDIADLVAKVRRNQIDLQPDFQRGQVWNDRKKKRLVDTVLRGWYIPAVHIVVNDDLMREEVLDGQQRIRSLIDFMEDRFTIDGHIQPYDENIVALHGKLYSNLPERVRARFDRFTLTTIRLREYRSGEPGELFFRLNQLTSLTAAEQRNALVGEPRNQIKELVERLFHKVDPLTVGFSNARMNYDDVISRLALAFEERELGARLTAAKLEARYRSEEPFPQRVIVELSRSIDVLSDLVNSSRVIIRLNKASLFSWLLFFCSPHVHSSSVDRLEFFTSFEVERYGRPELVVSDSGSIGFIGRERYKNHTWERCLQIFNDRSSSRVNDSTSIVLRDLSLHLCAFIRKDIGVEIKVGIHSNIIPTLQLVQALLDSTEGDAGSRNRTESEASDLWGQARAIG